MVSVIQKTTCPDHADACIYHSLNGLYMPFPNIDQIRLEGMNVQVYLAAASGMNVHAYC